MQSPYRIDSISLQGIGVFENTRINFPHNEHAHKAEIHIFTGPNGCGKSTLLYALAAALNPVSGGDALVRKRYHGERSAINFSFSGKRGYIGVSPPTEPHTLSPFLAVDACYTAFEDIQHHAIYLNLPQSNNNEPLTKKRFDFAGFAYAGSRSEQVDFTLAAIEEIKQSPFEKSLSFTSTVRSKLLIQWIANNRTKAALARNDGAANEAIEYDYALNRIERFIDDICDNDSQFHLQRSPLSVQLEVRGERMQFDTLPEGLKSIICWVTDLALRLEAIPWREEQDIFTQPIILFLDEVDIHLHPKWQRRILPAIQKLLPNAQVFVSTHSPFVVGSIADAYVYRLPEPRHNACQDPSSVEAICAINSKAGKSYQYILSEVFDIKEEFDVETERLLAQFRTLIHAYLVTQSGHDEIERLAKELRSKGDEVEVIVALELRQMKRVLNKQQG